MHRAAWDGNFRNFRGVVLGNVSKVTGGGLRLTQGVGRVDRRDALWPAATLLPVGRRVLVLCLFVLLPCLGEAQVSASLLAQDLSVQPNHPLTVVVRLEHRPAWHTFWVNAGARLPTSIVWDLPAGWSAGAIQWPVPTVIKNPSNEIIGQGYSDVADLAVTLAVPKYVKVGEIASLRARSYDSAPTQPRPAPSSIPI